LFFIIIFVAAIGIFNVVKFKNAVCDTGGAKNGTCYTAEECSNRNGVATGSCAEGFGVCCVITLSCGDTTSENCTYLSQTASNTPSTNSDTSNGCTYTICPASKVVSRIRLALTMFTIAGPVAPTTTDGTATGTLNAGAALGSCNMDTFSVTGSTGPYPVICGVNDGQHMVVDTDGTTCVKATFSYGIDTVMRNYNIHVIQYDRLNEMGGPTGCLQYFTGLMGTVRSFNWQAVTSTHLQNQFYDVCVRRFVDRCVICWSPSTSGNGSGAQVGDTADGTVGSFGISNAMSTDTAAMSGSGADCPRATNDVIVIPNGASNTDAAVNDNVVPGGALNMATVTTLGGNDFCGRYFNAAAAGAGAASDGSICTRTRPFRLGVRFGATEVAATTAGEDAVAMMTLNEASGNAANEDPLGTQGFSLGFEQFAC